MLNTAREGIMVRLGSRFMDSNSLAEQGRMLYNMYRFGDFYVYNAYSFAVLRPRGTGLIVHLC